MIEVLDILSNSQLFGGLTETHLKEIKRIAVDKKFNKGASRYKLTKFIDISLDAAYVKGKTGEAKIRTYQGNIIIDEMKK